MARKHSKKFARKMGVEHILIKPAVITKERECREVPAGTEGAIPIQQTDGSMKFFVVTFKEVTPAVYRIRPFGPTTTRGKLNDPEKHMAPKGKAGQKK